jgi:hypothetical protein
MNLAMWALFEIGYATPAVEPARWEPFDAVAAALQESQSYAYPALGYSVYGPQPYAGMEMQVGAGVVMWVR